MAYLFSFNDPRHVGLFGRIELREIHRCPTKRFEAELDVDDG